MFTNTPNMSLPIPAVGNEPGPDYAVDVNNALTLVDSHDHSPGKGVLITPSGLNISDDLPFNNNFAINLAGANFLAQGSTPSINTVYVSGVDLFFVDGLGNNIRVTQSGGVAGTPGSITNLIPPASATYVPSSKTFVWQSGVNAAANMDFASAIFRNITPNSTFGITMSAPASLGSNNSITLPLQPASKKFLTMTSAGVQAADTDVDNSTIVIASNTLKVPTSGITNNEIAVGTITADRLAFAVGLQEQTFNASGTWTRPTGVTWAIVLGCGGGSGGGGGAGGANDSGGGGGGAGTIQWSTMVDVTSTPTVAVVVGSGGAGGVGSSVPGTATSGSAGGNSSFGTIIFRGATKFGAGGTGATAPVTGAGGAGAGSTFNIQEQSSAGANGGAGPNGGTGGTGGTGDSSNYAAGGAGGAGGTQSGGGGGGGAGLGVGGFGGSGTAASSGTGNPGETVAANTGAGGGGGGGRANAGGTGTGGSGGAGGSGFVRVFWVPSQ